MTAAQDYMPDPVQLVTGDGYCINGSRLRLTSGTAGIAGSVYQTEIADFSQITANGTAGNGPAYFTVRAKSGLTYYYGFVDSNGNGANSQALAHGTSTALSWFLSKVVDRAGNNYVINYTAQTGTAVPYDILWTPISVGASNYAYKMLFNYTTNAPQSSIHQYVAGTLVSNNQLLSSIEIFSGTTVVKDYFLGYQASPLTAREELISVTECADSVKSNCLMPTAISYKTGTPGLSTISNSAVSSTSGNWLTARYDLNGDGYPDLAYSNAGGTAIAFGSASGYGAPISVGSFSTVLFGNLTAGSQDGYLANNSGTWWYYTWSGSSFTGTSTGLAVDSAGSQWQLADINGDGRPDLIELVVTFNSQTRNATATVKTRLNTSSASTVSFSSTVTTGATFTGILTAQLQTPDTQWGKLRRFDFNGDGLDDLVVVTTSQSSPSDTLSTYELLSTRTGFTTSLIASTNVGVDTHAFFTNWNDDKCTDFVFSNTLYVSGCNGTVSESYILAGAVVAALDWDGDGRTDLMVANGSTLGVYLSKATGAPTLTATSIPYTSNCQFVWMDANGDGLDDLACWSQTGSHPLTYYLHNGTSDIATSFADGFGNSASPSYGYLTQAGNLYLNFTDAVYPYQNYIGPMYVVNQVVFSDPTNMPSGTYYMQYSYYGAWMNLQGRGFSGFNDLGIYDSRTQVWDFPFYRRDFPYTGMLSQDWTELPNQPSSGALFSRKINNTFAAKTLEATSYIQRYFPYVSNSTTSNYELGGSENGSLISTFSTNYTFDNYGNATNITTTVTDNDPGSPNVNPFFNDTWTTTTANTITPNTSTWCLNLPTQAQVINSSTAPGGAAITGTVNFTPDYTNCRMTQKVTAPGTAYQVTEMYGYDPTSGNLLTDSVTGVAMSARTTTLTWNVTGQFPATIQNPLSQTITLGFDPNTGLKTSQSDPNSTTSNPIVTTWSYDPFMRMISEGRPDKTSTSWAYNNCATNGCVNANNRMTVTKTDNSTQSVRNVYLDALDRELVTSGTMINGAFDRQEIQYDNEGRIYRQGAPCTFVGCTTYWTTNSYDALNRMTQSQRPISATNSNLQTTSLAYAGRTTSTTDPYGVVSRRMALVTGNLAQTRDAAGYFVNLSYDAFGSLSSVVDSSSNTLHTTSYAYGIGAFKTAETDADLGINWTYTNDALGEVTSWKDAKNQHFSAQYDGLGRMTNRTEPDLSTVWNWGTSATSENIGKLQSVTSQNASGVYSEAYGYDSVGRPVAMTITIPADASYTYTSAYSPTTGQLTSLQYPVSTSSYQLKLNYAYSYGILTHVSNAISGVNYWIANSANPLGELTQETLGNGVVVNHAYDAVTGWLNSIQAGVGGGAALQNNSYQFDEKGNLAQRQTNNSPGITENFYYDALYRLDHSLLNGAGDEQRSYDGSGNVLTWGVFNSGAANVMNYSTPQSGCTYYANTQPHAVRSNTNGGTFYSMCYDANGNSLSMSTPQHPTWTRNITWTSFNQPSSVSAFGDTSQFDYNADHQRYRQTATYSGSPETTIYVGGLMEKVSTSAGVQYRHYIPAGSNKVLYTRISTGTNSTYYITGDHLGSTTTITDSTGTLLASGNYSSSGLNRNSTWNAYAPPIAQTITRHGFTGQEMLDNVSLVNLNGRVLDPSLGRMQSPDPLVTDATNTQSYNRYSYVLNNPLTFTDPTGFYCDGPPAIPTIPTFPDGGTGQTNVGDLPEIVVAPPCLPPEHFDIPNPQYDPGPPPIPSMPRFAEIGPPAAGGHEYETHNPVCRRPLTDQEKRELISRFTVPNSFKLGQPAMSGTHLVANGWGIPGGWVTTTFAPNGLSGSNVTTPFHVFTGTVERSVSNVGGVSYMDTLGYGGYNSQVPTPSQYGSSLTTSSVDIGGLLDSINDLMGPWVFDAVDAQALRYAMNHFPGC
jgi:RHS repeat-associated protein